MTKEELEKEAEEKCAKYKLVEMETYEVEAYIEGAEPREKRIAELEKENAKLKTEKIPQLERKIASIRGAHSVDVKKLNARIEQVEILKKENAELKAKNKWYSEQVCNKECAEVWEQLTKAKEIIENIIRVTWEEGWNYSLDWKVKAEQFLKEVSE